MIHVEKFRCSKFPLVGRLVSFQHESVVSDTTKTRRIYHFLKDEHLMRKDYSTSCSSMIPSCCVEMEEVFSLLDHH